MKKGMERRQAVNLVKPVSIPAGQVVLKTRSIGPKYPCPRCGGDGFVASTRRYPQVIEQSTRMRYLKCGACGETWKA